MGRPKGGTNTNHSKEEKLSLVLRNLAGESLMSLQRETGIYNAQIHKWTKQYLEGGEEALVNEKAKSTETPMLLHSDQGVRSPIYPQKMQLLLRLVLRVFL